MTLLLKLVSFTENTLTHMVAMLSRHRFNTTRYRFNMPEVWYSPWNEDKKFNAIYNQITKHTIISKRKVFDLYQIARQINRDTDHAVLEIGTYRGGSAAIFAFVFPEQQLILWDRWDKTLIENTTFIKKAYANTDDLHRAKSLLTQTQTRAAINAIFINDTFPNISTISSWSYTFSIVHFDIYDASAFTDGITLLWPQLADNGVFIVGGYGAISLDPLTEAVNQFVTKNSCLFIQSQSGIGLIFKKKVI